MGRAFRRHRNDPRNSDRVPLHAPLYVTTDDGKPAAPLSRCVEVGLGGLRVTAAEGLPPGTHVHITLRLPSGRWFDAEGRVAWSRQTLHPSIFGSPRGADDDASFGIAFDAAEPDALLPIARLLASRDRERSKALRISRRYGLPIHA